jgi:hypothetical protein
MSDYTSQVIFRDTDGRVKAARYLEDVTSAPGIYLDADPALPTRRHPDLQRELTLLAP